MTWFVYHLIDPRTDKPFYVGCTKNPSVRVRAHHSDSDWTGSASVVCHALKDIGLRATMALVGGFNSQRDALLEEARQISEVPNVVNIQRLSVSELLSIFSDHDKMATKA